MNKQKMAPIESRKPTVSLIIPTLNEAKNLPLVLPYIPLDVVDEIILVDGRSKDNTVEVARQLLPSIKVVLEKKRGKGAALRNGYMESTGDILVVIDADGSHDPREIPRFVQALKEGADFVKGSRFAPSGGTTDMPRLRKLGNWGFTNMVNILFSQSFSDLCYGFHAFWRHCLDYLDLTAVDGFEVDTAIYLQAVRKKLKVIDVPSFEGFRFYGVGKLQTFPDGWRVLRTILREWNAGLHAPTQEPQVGFRSYGQLLTIKTTDTIPVTGTPQLDGGVDGGKSIINSVCYNLDDLFRLHTLNDSDLDFNELLPDVMVTVLECLGASGGSLVVFDQNMMISNAYRVFGRMISPFREEELADAMQQGLIGWVIKNRQPVLIRNTSMEPRWVRRFWEVREGSSRSAIVAPFTVEDQLVGVLTVTRPADRPFKDEDLDRLKGMLVRV